jgi:hypothetical protein
LSDTWLKLRFSITITKTWVGSGVDDGSGDGEGVGLGYAAWVGLGRGETPAWAEDPGEQAARRKTPSASATNLIPKEPTIRAGVRLRGGPWEIEVRPERGGRIVSLRLGGEELLDQGIGVDKPGAEGFVEGGAWGWDEMVPNVEQTGSLPDHGEAWRLAWSVVELKGSSAVMRCSGRVVPWELERSIELGTKVVSVSYAYTNRGSVPLLAYWCAHPLFRYEVGMEISAPGGERLANLPEGSSTKVFLSKGSVDRAGLRWESGAAVEVVWDRALTPYVGVWACNGDLGGYRQVAIEPATGGNDRPNAAEPPPLLQPGGRFQWWLEVRDAR